MATLPEINSGRQYPLVAVVDIDLATTEITQGAETNILELPAGAVITGYVLQVRTIFDGTSPTADLGILSSVLDCLLDGVSLAAVEAFGGSLFGGDFGTTNSDGLDEAACVVSSSAVDYVTLKLVATDSTVGALRVIVEYVVPTRALENQG